MTKRFDNYSWNINRKRLKSKQFAILCTILQGCSRNISTTVKSVSIYSLIYLFIHSLTQSFINALLVYDFEVSRHFVQNKQTNKHTHKKNQQNSWRFLNYTKFSYTIFCTNMSQYSQIIYYQNALKTFLPLLLIFATSTTSLIISKDWFYSFFLIF